MTLKYIYNRIAVKPEEALKTILGTVAVIVIFVSLWFFYVGCCNTSSGSGGGGSSSNLSNTQGTGGYTPPGAPGPLNNNPNSFQSSNSLLQFGGPGPMGPGGGGGGDNGY